MSLKVENITSGYYKDIHVLHNVSLEARPKTVTCVIGPNGSGKSTLLKTIYGFLKPRKGRIIHNDEDITGLDPYAMLHRGIAYIPQERGIFPYLTVAENLKVGGWPLRKDKAKLEAKIQELSEKFPLLREKRRVKAGLLSGGQQKLLEICKALIAEPSMLLVDEPSSGLSPIVSKEIYDILESIAREGRTILLVDQNVRKAITMSHYVYVLELGRNKLQGSREEFELKLKDMVELWGFRKGKG